MSGYMSIIGALQTAKETPQPKPEARVCHSIMNYGTENEYASWGYLDNLLTDEQGQPYAVVIIDKHDEPAIIPWHLVHGIYPASYS